MFKLLDCTAETSIIPYPVIGTIQFMLCLVPIIGCVPKDISIM